MRFLIASSSTALCVLALAAAPSAADSWSDTKHGSSWNQNWYSDDSIKDFAYVYADAQRKTLLVFGNNKDTKEGGAWRNDHGAKSYLWMRDGKNRYYTEDPVTLEKVRAILKPQMDLSDEQSQLGDMQGKIGDQQAQLGDMQAELGDQQAELGSKQADLAAKTADAAVDGRVDRKSQKEMQELGAQQQELGQRQADLGKHQARMGHDQAKLGEEQAAAAKRSQAYVKEIRKQLPPVMREAADAGRAKKV